jgi:general stress protein CsbA
MTLVRGLSFLGVLAMLGALIYGFTVGDFFVDGNVILNNPWGIVSLVDLYVGFTLFSIWVFVREENKYLAALWIVSIMVLGFFSGALYVFLKSLRSSSMKELLLGRHA